MPFTSTWSANALRRTSSRPVLTFNRANAKHGLMNPAGSHAGGMPNLYVPADGKLEIEVLNPKATLTALLDANGAALVIHAGADDYKTDPAGNA
jgi:Cu-Zn family superoxide dismutase